MVLLVIDTQKAITDNKLYNFELFVANIKQLIETARKHSVEVIYIRHDDGKGTELTPGLDGFEIYEEFNPEETDKIFDKNVNSPFKESGLLEHLKTEHVKELIIAGLQTDYCIDAAVKCGFEHGFHIIVPAHANTTIDNAYMAGERSYKYYNEFLWKHRYADCLTMEETLELMKTHNDKGDNYD